MKRRRTTTTTAATAIAAALYHSILTSSSPSLKHHRRTKLERRIHAAKRPSAIDKWASSSEEEDEEEITSTSQRNRHSTSTTTTNATSSSPTSDTTNDGTSRSVECYTQIQALGEGQYGTVWKAKDRTTHKIVALKEFKLTSEVCGAEGFPSTALREINVLQSLDHPNIIKVHEVVVGTTTDKIYIVMDYVSVELGTLMVSMGDQPFSLPDAKCLLQQLLDAVSFLHERLLVHRDIKPTNILYHGASYGGGLTYCCWPCVALLVCSFICVSY